MFSKGWIDMTKLKHLITGGAGFIGSYLAEELLKKGDSVFIIDDLSTGNIENIEHLKNNEDFHYFIESVENEFLMAELVDKCDDIFHMAASVGVKLIVKDPVRTINNNIKTTEVVLKMARKKNKKVLLSSTSEVYGKGLEFPFKENSNLILGSPTRYRWSYACSKALDEFLALAYYKEQKLPIIIARLFNTVGPRQTGDYGMVIPTFINQALKNKPITVYGSGSQSRCFAHVLDVVIVLIKLMDLPDAIGQIFNIGNDNEITITELAKLVKEITKSKSKIRYISYDKAYESGFEDMMRRVPDISKIKKLINYRPQWTIEEIIKDMVLNIRGHS